MCGDMKKQIKELDTNYDYLENELLVCEMLWYEEEENMLGEQRNNQIIGVRLASKQYCIEYYFDGHRVQAKLIYLLLLVNSID